ncbi:MAG: cyanophycin synthetase, partial [Myxococcota bacterium]|nr:cyanophycin synthetase [Myxococcota bacterium]
PGDRRNEDILEIAATAASGPFDHIIVRRDDALRGREPDEVPKLLRQGLIDAGFAPEKITLFIDEKEAVGAGLEMCQRGDLLLVFGDNISRCWKQIVKFQEARGNEEQNVESESTLVDTPLHYDAAVLGDASMIVDNRGVRLAREESD